MGNNISNIPTSRESKDIDKSLSIAPLDALSNPIFIASIIQHIPKYPGTELPTKVNASSNVKSNLTHRIKNIFSSTRQRLSVHNNETLSSKSELENSNFNIMKKLRTRVILRMHVAYKNEFLTSQDEIKTSSLHIPAYISVKDDSNSILSSLSIQMCVTLTSILGQTNSSLFLSLSESIIEMLKLNGPLALKAPRSPAASKSIQSIIDLAESALKSNHDKVVQSQALGLLLAVATVVGSMKYILHVEMCLRKYSLCLPVNAIPFVQSLINYKSDTSITYPCPLKLSGQFQYSIVSQDPDYIPEWHSFSADGEGLVIWNGQVLSRIGTGFHGTLRDQPLQPSISESDILKEYSLSGYSKNSDNPIGDVAVIKENVMLYCPKLFSDYNVGMFSLKDFKFERVLSFESLFGSQARNTATFRYLPNELVHLISYQDANHPCNIVIVKASVNGVDITSQFDTFNSSKERTMLYLRKASDIYPTNSDYLLHFPLDLECSVISTSEICNLISSGSQLLILSNKSNSSAIERLGNINKDIIITSASFHTYNIKTMNHVTKIICDLWSNYLLNPETTESFTVSPEYFGDPCPGQEKFLFINFSFRGDDNKYSINYIENDLVSLKQILDDIVDIKTRDLPIGLKCFTCTLNSSNDKILLVHECSLSLPDNFEINKPDLELTSYAFNGAILLAQQKLNENEYCYFAFDIQSGGSFVNFEHVTYSNKFHPNCLCFDGRNNIIWGLDTESDIVLWWNNEGSTPINPFYGAQVTSIEEATTSHPLANAQYCMMHFNDTGLKDCHSIMLLSVLENFSYNYSPPDVSSLELHQNEVEISITAPLAEKEAKIAFGSCHIYIRGRKVCVDDAFHGYFCVVLDSVYSVSDCRLYDNCNDVFATERMADFISSLSDGTIVIIACDTDSKVNMSMRAKECLNKIGADNIFSSMADFNSVGIIGVKGMIPGSASQVVVESGNHETLKRSLPKLWHQPLHVDTSDEVIITLINEIIVTSEKYLNGQACEDCCRLTSYCRILAASFYHLPSSEEVPDYLENSVCEKFSSILTKVCCCESEKLKSSAILLFVYSINVLYPKPIQRFHLIQSTYKLMNQSDSKANLYILRHLLGQLRKPLECCKLLQKFRKISLKNFNSEVSNGVDCVNLLMSMYQQEFCSAQSSLLSEILESLNSMWRAMFNELVNRSTSQDQYCIHNMMEVFFSFSVKLITEELNRLSLGEINFKQFESRLFESPIQKILPTSLIAAATYFETTKHSNQVNEQLETQSLSKLSVVMESFQALLNKMLYMIPLNEIIIEEVVPQTACADLIYQSEHPYNPNMDLYEEIHIPGAISYQIIFDPNTRLEHANDYITFLRIDRSASYHPSIPTFTGRDGTENFPGYGGRPPLEIPSSHFIVHFHSDGSVQDWGYRFTVKGNIPKPTSTPTCHWIENLNRQFSLFATSLANRLIRGTDIQFDEHFERTEVVQMLSSKVIHPDIFQTGVSNYSEVDKFMMDLVDRPKNSHAETFVSIMKKYVKEDQGTVENINRAVYSTCSAIIKLANYSEVAFNIAGKKNISDHDLKYITTLWKAGQNIRQKITLSDANPDSITTLAQFLICFGSSHAENSPLEETNEKSKSLKEIKKRLIRSMKHSALISTDDINKVIQFVLCSDTIIQDMKKAVEIRNRRARLRRFGIKFLAIQIYENPSMIVSEWAAMNFSLSLSEIKLSELNEHNYNYHYCKGLEGCSSLELSMLVYEFSEFASNCLRSLLNAIKLLDSQSLQMKKVEDLSVRVIKACLKSCVFDFDSDLDNFVLERVNMVSILKKVLFSEYSDIKSLAETIFEMLVTFATTNKAELIHNQNKGSGNVQVEVIKLLTSQLASISDRLKSKPNSYVQSEGSEIQLLSDYPLSLSKSFYGFSYKHIPLNLSFELSFMIYRPYSIVLDSKGSEIKSGSRIMRGDDWVASNNEDGGIGCLGTVRDISNDFLAVEWDVNQGVIIQYHISELSKLSLVDLDVSGLLFIKGSPGFDDENKINSAWSYFGMSILPNGKICEFIASGEQKPYYFTGGFIPPNKWVRVIMSQRLVKTQNKKQYTDSLEALIKIEHLEEGTIQCKSTSIVLPNSLKVPGFKRPSKVIESPHPYLDNQDAYTMISVPGAISLSITFDAKSSTELTYDYLKFYSKSTRSIEYGETYSGGRNNTKNNFPGVEGRPPLVIHDDGFELFFHSDSSNDDWGYKIYISATMAPTVNNVSEKALLNSSPFFFGQLASYILSSEIEDKIITTSTKAFIKEFKAGNQILKSTDITTFSGEVFDDIALIPTLDILDRTISERLVLYDHLSGIVASLMNIIKFSSSLPKSSALRILSRLVKFYGIQAVQFFQSDFIEFLLKDMGSRINVKAYYNSSKDDILINQKCSENFHHFLGVAKEQKLLLINLISSCEKCKSEFIEIMGKIIQITRKLLESDQSVFCNSSEEIEYFNGLYGILSFLGGDYESLYVGAKGLLSIDGLEEICYVLEFCNHNENANSSDYTGFGDFLRIFLEEHDNEIIVPYYQVKPFSDEAAVNSFIADVSSEYLQSLFDFVFNLEKSYLTQRKSEIEYEIFMNNLRAVGMKAFKYVLQNRAELDKSYSNYFKDFLSIALLSPPCRANNSTKDVDNASVRIFESNHPYENDLDVYTTVHVEGAKSLVITFDSQSCTEHNYDFVRIYKDTNHDIIVPGGEKFSGGLSGDGNWAGVGACEPLVVEGDHFEIYFHSDPRLNAWGYKMFVTPKYFDHNKPAIPSAPDVAFRRSVSIMSLIHDSLIFSGSNKVTPSLDNTPSLESDIITYSLQEFSEIPYGIKPLRYCSYSKCSESNENIVLIPYKFLKNGITYKDLKESLQSCDQLYFSKNDLGVDGCLLSSDSDHRVTFDVDRGNTEENNNNSSNPHAQDNIQDGNNTDQVSDSLNLSQFYINDSPTIEPRSDSSVFSKNLSLGKLLIDEIEDIDSSLKDHFSAASIGFAFETIALMISKWPKDVELSVFNFGGVEKYLKFLQLALIKSREYSIRNKKNALNVALSILKDRLKVCPNSMPLIQTLLEFSKKQLSFYSFKDSASGSYDDCHVTQAKAYEKTISTVHPLSTISPEEKAISKSWRIEFPISVKRMYLIFNPQCEISSDESSRIIVSKQNGEIVYNEKKYESDIGLVCEGNALNIDLYTLIDQEYWGIEVTILGVVEELNQESVNFLKKSFAEKYTERLLYEQKFYGNNTLSLSQWILEALPMSTKLPNNLVVVLANVIKNFWENYSFITSTEGYVTEFKCATSMLWYIVHNKLVKGSRDDYILFELLQIRVILSEITNSAVDVKKLGKAVAIIQDIGEINYTINNILRGAYFYSKDCLSNNNVKQSSVNPEISTNSVILPRSVLDCMDDICLTVLINSESHFDILNQYIGIKISLNANSNSSECFIKFENDIVYVNDEIWGSDLFGCSIHNGDLITLFVSRASLEIKLLVNYVVVGYLISSEFSKLPRRMNALSFSSSELKAYKISNIELYTQSPSINLKSIGSPEPNILLSYNAWVMTESNHCNLIYARRDNFPVKSLLNSNVSILESTMNYLRSFRDRRYLPKIAVENAFVNDVERKLCVKYNISITISDEIVETSTVSFPGEDAGEVSMGVFKPRGKENSYLLYSKNFSFIGSNSINFKINSARVCSDLDIRAFNKCGTFKIESSKKISVFESFQETISKYRNKFDSRELNIEPGVEVVCILNYDKSPKLGRIGYVLELYEWNNDPRGGALVLWRGDTTPAQVDNKNEYLKFWRALDMLGLDLGSTSLNGDEFTLEISLKPSYLLSNSLKANYSIELTVSPRFSLCDFHGLTDENILSAYNSIYRVYMPSDSAFDKTMVNFINDYSRRHNSSINDVLTLRWNDVLEKSIVFVENYPTLLTVGASLIENSLDKTSSFEEYQVFSRSRVDTNASEMIESSESTAIENDILQDDYEERVDETNIDDTSESNENVDITPALAPNSVAWNRFRSIIDLNKSIISVLPNVYFDHDLSKDNFASWLVSCREYILYPLKKLILEKALRNTSTEGTSQFELKLSRSRARNFALSHKIDHEGRFTVFSQAFRVLHFMEPKLLRRSGQIYNTIFVGEKSQDAGGPYRESFGIYIDELQSSTLPLFISSQNGKNAVGYDREKWVLNPDAKSQTHLEMLSFLGKLIGICLRSDEYLTLNLPSIIWKLIVDEKPTLEDLERIDYSLVRSYNLLLSCDENIFESTFFETFTTTSASGSLVELCTNGSNINVSFSNRKEYVNQAIQYHLHQFDEQVSAIKHGISTILPLTILSLFDWKAVETMICGVVEVDLVLLKSVTEHSSCSANDPHVQLFWQALEEFNNEERTAFIRFVWGRSRLPLEASKFSQKFKIQNFTKSPADSFLPVAHTCFFSIDLPAYSSLEIMKQKLRYAITNCHAIDADDTDAGQAAAALGMEE